MDAAVLDAKPFRGGGLIALAVCHSGVKSRMSEEPTRPDVWVRIYRSDPPGGITGFAYKRLRTIDSVSLPRLARSTKALIEAL
jgi:hypothetical protein